MAEELGAFRVGSVIRVSVTDADVNSVLDLGFDRVLIERSDDLGITWTEATLPSDRIVLEKDKVSYAWKDLAGDPSYLYRSRYIDTRTAELGDPSEPIEGEGLAVAQILPVAVLKDRYLFGVDFRDDNGRFLPDAVWQHYILQSVEWMEKQLDIPLLPTTFIERQDYIVNNYEAFNFLQLDKYPVISIEEFNVQYPSGQNVITYPPEWLRLDKDKGLLRIVPTAGTLAEVFIGQGGSYLPAIFTGTPTLPDLFEIRYTAGFPLGKVPRDILDLVGMFASLGPLNIFGDLIAGAGIANISLSMDGLSQSIGTTSSATNAGYGSRIIQYLKQIKEQIPNLRRYYKGVRMAVA